MLAEQPEPTLDTQLDVYQDAWRQRETAEVLFGKGDDANTLRALAKQVLAAFRASQYARPTGMILGALAAPRDSAQTNDWRSLVHEPVLIPRPTKALLALVSMMLIVPSRHFVLPAFLTSGGVWVRR